MVRSVLLCLALVSFASAQLTKKLLIDMMAQGNLVAQKDTSYANVYQLPTGEVVMSALQKEPEQPLDPDTIILQFDYIQSMAERPNKIFFRLEQKSRSLGYIIIVLNGAATSRVKQMLQLSTGGYSVNDNWRRSEMIMGGWTRVPGYMTPNGVQKASLYPVERDPRRNSDVPPGQVRGSLGQTSSFIIYVGPPVPGFVNSYPKIGQVTSGLDILLTLVQNKAGAVTISDCGLVVIE